MRHDWRFSPILWGLLVGLGLLGSEANADALRAQRDGVCRPGADETSLWPLPPCSDAPVDSPVPAHSWADFSPSWNAKLAPALPPIDLPITEDPWQPLPTVPEHLPERALALDSKIRIPEPASVVLLTTGLVGLIARRYLRRMHA